MSSPDWKPFIEPTNLEIAKDGKKISFQSIPKTDWWRTGKVHSTNGAYVAVEHEKTLERVKSLELKASVHLEGDHQFDQGGIFLYISDTLWIKAGIEMVEGKAEISCVVCDPYSDWAIYPVPSASAHTFGFKIEVQADEPLPLIKITYNGETLRELPAFGLAQDEGKGKFRIGVMGCSPLSDGCKLTFDGLSLESS